MTRSFLKSLAFVLAVPILVSAIALTARDRFDENWVLAIRRQAAMRGFRITARDMAGRSLATLCTDPRQAAQYPACRVYNRFFQLTVACGVTAGAGLALLGGVALLGFLQTGRRRRFARLFRATLYVVLGLVALLLIVHGVLAAFGLVLLGELLGSSDPSLGILLGLFALAMAVATLRLARRLDARVRLTIVGQELDLAAQPRLAGLLGELAQATGAPAPDQVVVGLVPDICLTGAEVDCLDGVFGGRTLYLSLSLCRILSPAELRGILAHEFARSASDGAALGTQFYPVYAGAARRRSALAAQRGIVHKALLGPALAVTGLLFDAIAEAESSVAASRELEADRVAAQVAGLETYAAALIKLHAFDAAWDLVDQAMDQAGAFGTAWTNASALFAEVVVDNAGAERLKGLSDRVRAHPTEQHLPLARRLAALAVDPARVSAAALETAMAPSALSLVAGAEEIEEALSGALQTIKARHRDIGYAWE